MAKPFSRYYVYFIIVWLAIWIPLRYYNPITLRVRHTYLLPTVACTGVLVSDFDAFNTVREGLVVLYILVPFSICFMLWTHEKIGWGLHIATAAGALVWAIIMFVYDIIDMVNANVPPNDVNFDPTNLARDNRFCLVYGGQPNTDLFCSNTGPCSSPAIDPSTLMVNGPFVYRFSLNLLIMIMIAFSFYLAYIWKRLVLDEEAAQRLPPIDRKVKYANRWEEVKK